MMVVDRMEQIVKYNNHNLSHLANNPYYPQQQPILPALREIWGRKYFLKNYNILIYITAIVFIFLW
jgi:hypothetical protein